MFNILKHSILSPIAIILATAPNTLTAQSNNDTYYYDDRSYKPVKLMVLADAHFNARKMKLDFRNVDQAVGTPMNLAKEGWESLVQTATQETLAHYIPALSGIITGPGGWIITSAQIIHSIYVNTTHVRERNYVFAAPVAGRYQIKVWVPGDWDKPCSMIKVYSVNTSSNTKVLEYSYDKSNVSDRTEIITVNLPAGLIHVSVSVGSGTLNTHTAGRMVESMLDNSSYLQWTVPLVPIAGTTTNIATSLLNVGSTCIKTLPYTANPGVPPSLIDGTVTYSNHVGLVEIQPLPPSTIGALASGNPNHGYLPGTHITTNMDVEETVSPTLNGQTATFSFLRLDDFISRVLAKFKGPIIPEPII